MLDTENEAHPLLTDYLRRNGDTGIPPTIDFDNGSQISDTSSIRSLITWTTCDELKRCTCAVLSFILMATLIGSALVVFWFLWAWFVLWLNLPGIATPVVWLCGFLAPLCLFRLISFCPRCTKGCCSKPLKPPEINSWKTNHLWKERREHVDAILKAQPKLPSHLGELISDYCFHSDILVTTKESKLIGVYPDTGQTHTIAEFSQNLTDLTVKGGNIHNVFVLLRREMEPVATHFRSEVGCETNENTPLISNDINNIANNNNNNNSDNNNNDNRSIWKKLPEWLWDPTEYVDMIICEYDLSKGILKQNSNQFSFNQITNTTMQQLKGIYYKPHYRILCDEYRNKLVVSRDGEFLIFDKWLHLLSRRELIHKPETANDREQFLHISEYKWQSMIIIPPLIVKRVLNIVDIVERTDSTYLIDDDEIYVMIPFSEHALFVGNLNTGWLRYLDFSHVYPISSSEIHLIEFSQDNQYMYITMTQKLTLMNTVNFQALLTIPYTNLDYTIPCGIVRLPPEELQLLMMKKYYYDRAINDLKSNKNNNEKDIITSIDDSECLTQPLPQLTYNYEDLRKKLESICIFFTSTRVFLDPRAFIYRFPLNKSKVITSKKSNSKRKLFDGGFLLERYTGIHKHTNTTAPLNSPNDSSCGGWYYMSLKQRPWNMALIAPSDSNSNSDSIRSRTNNISGIKNEINSYNFGKFNFEKLTVNTLNTIDELDAIEALHGIDNEEFYNREFNEKNKRQSLLDYCDSSSDSVNNVKFVTTASTIDLNDNSNLDSYSSSSSDDIPSVVSNDNMINDNNIINNNINNNNINNNININYSSISEQTISSDKQMISQNNENEYVVPIV